LVTKSPSGPYYAPGDSVDLVAAPRRGYHFVGWSGDASGSQPRLRVAMNANKTITATFAVDSDVLDVGIDGQGSVTKTPDMTLYPRGTSVLLTATPAPGWRFVGWTQGPGDRITSHLPGDIRSVVPINPTANPLQITIEGGTTLIATFAQVSGPAATRIDSRLAKANQEREARDTGSLPTVFALVSIVPNPTRGTALLEFTVARETRVRLSVLDIQGREVAILRDAILPAGRYRTAWDATTSHGPAPAGVYFVRYRAGGRDQVRRLLLTR